MGNAERDGNAIPTILGISKDDSSVIVPIKVNPVTGRMLVEIIGGGDVSGPASSVNLNIAVFDGVTGKLIKDGGNNIAGVLDRANHTGTQIAATISDFDIEVSNNTDVAANTTHRSNTSNPHSVTKSQVGLGNVDNTSDATKNSAVAILTNKTIAHSNNTLGGVTMGLGSDADGDTYYRASNVLTRLAKGTAGQVYTMNAGATAPEWADATGGAVINSSIPEIRSFI